MLFRAVGTAVMLALAWGACGAAAAAAARATVCAGEGAAFGVESTVLLNEAERHDGEVGYRLRARLALRPVWSHGDQHLLRLQLEEPQLLLRGKRANAPFVPHKSVWDSFPSTEFYAHLNEGVVEAAYLDPREPLDILNYKRSLISLLQVQVTEEEHNETDISGTCEVSYETLSENVIRKIKRRCLWGGEAAGEEELRARRLLRYELGECGGAGGAGGGGVRAVHAEELAELGGAGGLKARAWTQLRREGAAAGAGGAQHGSQHGSLRAALGALPPGLVSMSLPLHAAPDATDAPVQAEEVRAAAERWADALAGERAGGGGGAAQALAALRLLRVLRAAPAAALRPLLARGASPALCRLLGAAGAPDAPLALRLRAPAGAGDGASVPCAAAYLAGLALAPAPPERLARDALALAEEAREPALRDRALLAGAAAASAGAPDLRQYARELLLKGLARCEEEACREVRLHALGNLRDAAAAEPVLRRAEGGSRREALAALGALARLQATVPGAADAPPSLRARLARLALGAARPLELRAAALELLAARCRRREHAALLARLALQLDARGPPELRRLLRMRLRALADGGGGAGCGAALRPLLPALGGGGPRGWAGRAAEHAAASSVLARRPGWGGAPAGGWRARLDSVQVAAGAVLRRGAVALLAEPPDAPDAADAADEPAEPLPLLAVELWTQGLEELTGGGAGAAADAGEDAAMCVGADGDGEGAGAGGARAELALSVGGVRLRGVELFAGQTELLAHVWAGAGSEPTPVLRALRPARPRRRRHPLLAGVELRAELHQAALYALDAQAQVSLWGRTARSLLELRAAAARQAELRVRPAWGELRADSTQRAEAALDVAADLDFYDGVALCVRVSAAGQRLWSNATLQARLGAAPGLRVRRERAATLRGAGRSLALGAPNDAACRTLTAA